MRLQLLPLVVASATLTLVGCSSGPQDAEVGDCTTRPIELLETVDTQEELDEALAGDGTGADSITVVDCEDDGAEARIVKVVPGVTFGESTANAVALCRLEDDEPQVDDSVWLGPYNAPDSEDTLLCLQTI